MKITAVAISALLLASCTNEAEHAVRAYNDALIVAFRTGDLAPLQSVAGEGERRKVEALVDLKRSSGLVLESTLESFAVEERRPTGSDGMIIETAERWRYFDRATVPGSPPGREVRSTMRMQYELGRDRHKRWRVLKVRTISNDILRAAGGR